MPQPPLAHGREVPLGSSPGKAGRSLLRLLFNLEAQGALLSPPPCALLRRKMPRAWLASFSWLPPKPAVFSLLMRVAPFILCGGRGYSQPALAPLAPIDAGEEAARLLQRTALPAASKMMSFLAAMRPPLPALHAIVPFTRPRCPELSELRGLLGHRHPCLHALAPGAGMPRAWLASLRPGGCLKDKCNNPSNPPATFPPLQFHSRPQEIPSNSPLCRGERLGAPNA